MPKQCYTRTNEHMIMKDQIASLTYENQILKKRLRKIQDAMYQIYLSKKKYKTRYKQVRQKLDILQTVYRNRSNQNFNAQSLHYHKNQFEDINTGSDQNLFFKLKPLGKPLKQDLTSNTIQTMPSSRKSEFKQVRNKDQKIQHCAQSKTQLSGAKNVGKIFRFKSQQRQNVRNQSSGSQIDPLNNYISGYARTKHNIQPRIGAPENFEVASYIGEQNHLKQLIMHLLSELQQFSPIKKSAHFQQNQQKILDSEINIREKLQYICSKLKEIQKSQQILVMKQNQREQRIISNTKIKSQKSLNRSTSGGKLNTSFLKTIQDIGRDLTQWKIDNYYQGV